MSATDIFDEVERREFIARGFTVTDAVACAEGTMTVAAVPHGHFHFLIRVTLPNGSEISGFVPRSKIIPPIEAL
jgi:hypothetical protein